MRKIPDNSIQCCVTSPPYWGLRDYGHDDQIGLESSPQIFVRNLTAVFEEVRRILKEDGTLWLNLGDSYYNYRPGKGQSMPQQTASKTSQDLPQKCSRRGTKVEGLKEKDLCGMPWRVALALQDAGWYLRSDIIWAKPNPMPESVKDRPTKAHEYIFLMTKNSKYLYDHEAIKEECVWDTGDGTEKRKQRAKENHKAMPTSMKNGIRPKKGGNPHRKDDGRNCNYPYAWGRAIDGSAVDKRNGVEVANGFRGGSYTGGDPGARKNKGNVFMPSTFKRNKRTVWNIATKAFKEAHFATFPPELPEICIKAGSKEGDIVFDPFGGAFTTALVARSLGRKFICCELSQEYCEIADKRLSQQVLF